MLWCCCQQGNEVILPGQFYYHAGVIYRDFGNSAELDPWGFVVPNNIGGRLTYFQTQAIPATQNVQRYGAAFYVVGLPAGGITTAQATFLGYGGDLAFETESLQSYELRAAHRTDLVLGTQFDQIPQADFGSALTWPQPTAWTVNGAGSLRATPNLAPIINPVLSLPGWTSSKVLCIALRPTSPLHTIALSNGPHRVIANLTKFEFA